MTKKNPWEQGFISILRQYIHGISHSSQIKRKWPADEVVLSFYIGSSQHRNMKEKQSQRRNMLFQFSFINIEQLKHGASLRPRLFLRFDAHFFATENFNDIYRQF